MHQSPCLFVKLFKELGGLASHYFDPGEALLNNVDFILDRTVKACTCVITTPKDVLLLAFLDPWNIKSGELLNTAVEQRAVQLG